MGSCCGFVLSDLRALTPAELARRIFCCVDPQYSSNKYDEPEQQKSAVIENTYVVFLMFVFYLQQVALIVVDGVKYPQQWEKAAAWLKDIFLPNINFDFTIEDSIAVTSAIFLIPVFIHFFVIIVSKEANLLRDNEANETPRIFFSKIVYLLAGVFGTISLVLYLVQSDFWKVFAVLFCYMLLSDLLQRVRNLYKEKIFIPEKLLKGALLSNAREEYYYVEQQVYIILSLGSLTPVVAITINILVESISITIYLLFFYIMVYRSSLHFEDELMNYVGIQGDDPPIEAFQTSLETYRDGFKWMQILFLAEKMALTVSNNVFKTKENEVDITGGIISFGIILFLLN
eukprot:snap_masked-scaffold_7-processed-gene-3.49-mRNA-1 protein AED:1.00 eAED:1.00 QI:0/0/0/0/1/1/3/0/343